MTKKQTTTKKTAATTEAAPAPTARFYTGWGNNIKSFLLGGISLVAKVLTIVDIAARISLGVVVWFITVPQFVVYAATFLGVIGLLQALHMLWKAQQ